MKPAMKPAAARQQGVALVCALLLTLVAGVLGVAVGRLALASLAAAQWERDHAVARAAADTALRDAERDVEDDAGGPGLPAVAATYGERTGARMAVGGGLLPARLPAYRIERLNAAAPGQGALYRITAIGFGTRAGTQVVVQALYRKCTDSAPAGRIGWREIARWPAPDAPMDAGKQEDPA